MQNLTATQQILCGCGLATFYKTHSSLRTAHLAVESFQPFSVPDIFALDRL